MKGDSKKSSMYYDGDKSVFSPRKKVEKTMVVSKKKIRPIGRIPELVFPQASVFFFHNFQSVLLILLI